MNLAQRLGLSYYRTKIRTIGLVSPKKAAELAYVLFCTPRKPKKRIKPPPVFQHAERLELEVAKSRIRGFAWKNPNPGSKKILVLHGFSSYSYKFEKYISLFQKQGFEVFAFDAPAHGISEGKLINALIYREVILEIENKYGPFYGMLGHSLGGLAASLAFTRLDDQTHRRLALVAPATETRSTIQHFFELIRADEKVRSAFMQLLRKKTHEEIDHISTAYAVTQVHCPILWVHDKQDSICPIGPVIPVMEAKLPHIEFLITEGLGHSRIYKEQQVSQVIDRFFGSGLY